MGVDHDPYVSATASSYGVHADLPMLGQRFVQPAAQRQPQRFPQHKLNTSNFSFIPPTPMSAYFDAEDASVEYEETTLSTSSSPLTSSGTNGDGVKNDLNESPSPITPATPGSWKPRELTLLRTRVGTAEMDSKDVDRQPDLSSALDGLGIRGLSTGPTAQQAVRTAALRDILPVVSATSHARTMSSSTHSSQASVGPRELRLAGSLAAGATHRFGAMRNANSSPVESSALTPPMPAFRSRSPTVGSSPLGLTTSSRLPVRRGPAFDTSPVLDRPALDSTKPAPGTFAVQVASDSESGAKNGGLRSNGGDERPDGEDAASALRLSTTAPSPLFEDLGNTAEKGTLGIGLDGPENEETLETLQSSPMGLQERKGSITSMKHSIIETCASGSRKKGPPAPLVLLPSPSSTYSKNSLETSLPNSALSLPPTSSAGYEFGRASVSQPAQHSQLQDLDLESFLAPGTALSTVSATPFAGSHDAFLTPLQSPAAAAEGGRTPIDREAMTAGDLLSRLGTLDLESKGLEKPVKVEEARTTVMERKPEVWHRQTLSSTSSGNAFEYDSNTDGKRATIADKSTDSHEESSRHTSSLSSQSRRAPSPSPNLVFNTSIFSSLSLRPRSTTDELSPSYDDATVASQKSISSALNKSQSVEGQLSSIANDSHRMQHRTADVSWTCSASPLSASTSRSTDVTSVASRSQQSEHFEPHLSFGAASAGSRRSITTGKRGSTDAGKRRSSQIRLTKPGAEVPDVPSFGYMGTTPQPYFAPGSQQVSPTTTILPPQALHDAGDQLSVQSRHARAEIQGSSHWSSGSEDEDEQRGGSLKSTRKSSSRSRKGSQSAASFSGSISRRSTGVSSQHSLAPLKKANIFAGLGLRKKSAPTLLSDASSNASSPMPLPSESPIVGRSDGMREFPFPQQQQSKLSLSVTSLRSGTSSAAVSAAPSPISSPLMRIDHSLRDAGGDGTIRGATRFLQRQASTPSLAERFTATFNGPLRSKAAAAANHSPTEVKVIGSPITSTASIITTVRTPPSLMTPSHDSAAPSPLSDRGYDQDQQYNHPKSPALQGLGIQVGQERKPSSGNALEFAAAEKTPTSPDDSRKHTRNVSVKSYQSCEANTKAHDGRSSFLDDAQVKRSSLRNSGHRQRSMTINSSERASVEARDAAIRFYNGHRFPGTTFGFGDESAPPVPRLRRESVNARSGTSKSISTATSPNDTPQIPLIPLGSTITQPTGQDDEGDDGLYAMGKALAQSFATPPPSSPSTHAYVLPEKTKRRVRRTGLCARPHYNSLTEYGRAWQAAHAEESYLGAVGPALLELALSGSCCEGRTVNRNTVSSGTASSTPNEYAGVHAQGSTAHMQKHAERGARGQGGDDDRSDDYEDGKRYIVVEKDAYMNADDSESDGEYGGQDNDLPEVKPSALTTQNMAISKHRKEGSDEAPIGSSLRDPVQIMHKLQRSGTMPARSNRTKRTLAVAEVSSGSQQGTSIDVAELANRLHSLQRSSIHNHGHGATASTADQHAFPSSSPQGMEASGKLSLYDKLNKPLPDPKEATVPTSTVRSDQQSIISDFAQRVRKRSQSRSRMRPVAMDHSSSAPVPTVPVCNTLAQAIARSQSQPRSNEPDWSPNMLANTTPISSTVDGAVNSLQCNNEARSPHSGAAARLPLHRGRPSQCADELIEHRIYLAGMQRFQMAVVKRSACSRDLINSLAETNSLPSDENVGDWAIFDVRSDMGIERPLREYESIADVLSARHAVNARRGALLIKRSDLAPYLSVQAVPKAAPALAGWMYVLDGGRKASWIKRWCELRDGVLYSAKSERGRDEVQICDLKTFDVYTPLDGESTWASRAPKKNSFALCNVSSSPAVHDVNSYHFCMSDARAARHWITAISRARTFVMRNEAPGLFAMRTSSRNNASAAPSSSDAASSVISGPAMTRSPAAAPLVQLNTQAFEKGSLLAATLQGRTPPPQSQPLSRLHTNTGHRKPVPE